MEHKQCKIGECGRERGEGMSGESEENKKRWKKLGEREENKEIDERERRKVKRAEENN